MTRGIRPQLSYVALEEAEEAEDAATRLARMLREARGDGVITLDEIDAIERQASVVSKEIRDVVQATERVEIVQAAAVSMLSGSIGEKIIERMDDAGLEYEPLTAA